MTTETLQGIYENIISSLRFANLSEVQRLTGIHRTRLSSAKNDTIVFDKDEMMALIKVLNL